MSTRETPVNQFGLRFTLERRCELVNKEKWFPTGEKREAFVEKQEAKLENEEFCVESYSDPR